MHYNSVFSVERKKTYSVVEAQTAIAAADVGLNTRLKELFVGRVLTSRPRNPDGQILTTIPLCLLLLLYVAHTVTKIVLNVF